MRKIRIDFLLLQIFLYVNFFKQLYSYLGAEYVLSDGSLYGYQQLPVSNSLTTLMTTIALASLIGLFCMKLNSFRCGGGYALLMLVMLFGIIFWTTQAAMKVGITQLLHESAPPFIYLTALAVVVGFDNNLFRDFIKHAKIIGFASIALSCVYYVQFLQEHSGALAILANSAPLVYFVQGFWLLCIWCFASDEQIGNKIYILLGVFAVLAILFNSRSWIVQVVIWALVYAYIKEKRNGLIKTIKFMVVFAIVAGIVYMVVNNFAPEIFESLIEKTAQDTRSQQYKDIFNQTTLETWVFGGGYFFQYYSQLQGGMYSYIDNAFILMLVRYGLSIGLTYPLLLVLPIVGGLGKRGFQKEYMPVIMWLMALGGLSIYCAITVDIKSFAVFIIAGRILYLNGKKSKLGKGI